MGIMLKINISKELRKSTHPMTCKTLKEATASAKSMERMGAMLLWLCKRFLILFLLQYAYNTPSVA